MEEKSQKTQWIIVGILVVFLLIIWTFVLMELLRPTEPTSFNAEEEQEHTNIDINDILAELTEEEEEEVQTDTQKNLLDYDFSDIATKDGVPIDGILRRLGLQSNHDE